MPREIYTVDAFTSSPFAGNPAAVCPLPVPADEAWMRAVAREMNLSETAFLSPRDGVGRPAAGEFDLRWFTPAVEVALCGHATLASAHVLWETETVGPDCVLRFHTRSGVLTARRDAGREGRWIQLDFPAKAPEPADAPPALIDALGVTPVWVGHNRMDYLLELESEEAVRRVEPDHRLLRTLPVRGVIVTARSESAEFDFVSRFFAPGAGIDEDPVTGSAHCCLGPYWQGRLGRPDFLARQVSARGGVVRVGCRGDRVLLGGQAVTVLRGELIGT
jgi:PhzF family phenazine biosynthesis protein